MSTPQTLKVPCTPLVDLAGHAAGDGVLYQGPALHHPKGGNVVVLPIKGLHQLRRADLPAPQPMEGLLSVDSNAVEHHQLRRDDVPASLCLEVSLSTL